MGSPNIPRGNLVARPKEEIRFPETYDFRTRNKVLARLMAILRLRGRAIRRTDPFTQTLRGLAEEPLDLGFLFNLRSTTYIGFEQLAELVVLGRFCHSISREKVRVVFPDELRVVHQFFAPWNFFDFFYEWGDPESALSEKGIDGTVKKPLGLTRIAEFVDVRSVARNLKQPGIANTLRDSYGFDASHLNRFVDTIVSELCDNIPFHSMSEGLIAVQLHVTAPRVLTPRSYSPTIDIVICDGGIGIHESLKRRYPERYTSFSAGEALSDVFDGRVPQPEGRMRGGISRVKKTVRDFAGLLKIETPFAQAASFPDSQSVTDTSLFFPGTNIVIKLPRKILLR